MIEEGCEGFQSITYPHKMHRLTEQRTMTRSEYSKWSAAWDANRTCKPLGIFKGTELEGVKVAREFIECANGSCKLVSKFDLI